MKHLIWPALALAWFGGYCIGRTVERWKGKA